MPAFYSEGYEIESWLGRQLSVIGLFLTQSVTVLLDVSGTLSAADLFILNMKRFNPISSTFDHDWISLLQGVYMIMLEKNN